MGADPLTGAYVPFPTKAEKKQAANKVAQQIAGDRTQEEVRIRRQQLLDDSRERTLELTEGEGGVEASANASADASGNASRPASSASVSRSRSRQRSGEQSASLAGTSRMFALCDTTHLPDGTLAALCPQERQSRASTMRPRSRGASSRGDEDEPAAEQTLIPLEAWQLGTLGDTLSAYAGQPLATRGVIRQMRGQKPHPMPDPRGPPRKVQTKGMFRGKKFDDRGLFPKQTSAAKLPPKPHWSTPVLVQDYMPHKRG